MQIILATITSLILHQTKMHFQTVSNVLYLFADINECLSSPCVQGNCTDQVNGFLCNCIKGYTGITCDTGNDDYSWTDCFIIMLFLLSRIHSRIPQCWWSYIKHWGIRCVTHAVTQDVISRYKVISEDSWHPHCCRALCCGTATTYAYIDRDSIFRMLGICSIPLRPIIVIQSKYFVVWY